MVELRHARKLIVTSSRRQAGEGLDKVRGRRGERVGKRKGKLERGDLRSGAGLHTRGWSVDVVREYRGYSA
jgi:hypothetical protein